MIYLKLVSKVDNNGVAHWGNVDPIVIFEKLQAAYLVILEEEDDATGVGVSSETLDEIWLGTRRVIAHLCPKCRTFWTIESLLEITLFQPKILT